MPNIEWASSSTFTGANGTTISSVSKPANTEIGDLLLFQMYIEKGAGVGSYTIASTGDTWTVVSTATNTGATPDYDLVVWRCTVGHATNGITVSWDGTSVWRDYSLHLFKGVDQTTPEDCASTNNTGNSAAETGLSVTTVTDGAHLVMLTANFAGSTRSAWTSGLTERNDTGNVAMAAGVQLVAGSSGNKTNTITSGEWGAVLMALRPALGVINFGGFETGDFVDAVSSTGTVTAATAIKRSGNYSLRINPAAAAANVVYNAIGINGKAAEIGRAGTTYVTFYTYFTTLPAANCAFVRFRDSAANEVVRINVDTGGQITIIGTSTSATIATISTGTWYRMDMRITGNGTCGLKVDGGSETTLTGNNFTFDRITFGPTTAHTLDAYIEDWACSDSGFPASPKVLMSVPTGAGTYASFTDGTGSTYAEVDEVPHDSATTYLQNTSGTNLDHTLVIQSSSTIGVVGSIEAVKTLAVMAEPTSTSTLGGTRLRVSSTNYGNIPVDIGTTAYVAIQRLYKQNPGTQAAWTTGGFDAAEVGVFKGADASSIRATAAYALVLTDASVTGTAAATFPGLSAAATGTHTASGATGTAAATFPSLTASATGAQTQTGTAAATFPALSASASGVMQPSGTATATFPALSAAAAGTQAQTGTAAATFPGLTAAATGTHTAGATGTGAATFPGLAASASGTQIQSGAAGATFPAISASASGVMLPSGAAAATFPGLTASATGTQTHSGTAAATFPGLTASASGAMVPSGVAAATFPSLTAAALGSTGATTGTIAATFPSLTASATGDTPPSGTAAATFPSLTAAATGSQAHAGAASATFPSVTAAASGTHAQTGAAAATFPSFGASASGVMVPNGIGAAAFPALTAAAVGTHTSSGASAVGAMTFPALTASGQAYSPWLVFTALDAIWQPVISLAAQWQPTASLEARWQPEIALTGEWQPVAEKTARWQPVVDLDARYES